jgi:DNA-binding NarL/FixJ family response regulator
MAKVILVADDSASMRLSVRLLLESWNADLAVCEAIDGLDAIVEAKRQKPDLILLDLAMPRLNGAEAAWALKKAMPNTPIILFTMHTDLTSESLSSVIGVDAFVSKTEGISSLLGHIDTFLQRKSPGDGARP